MVFVDALAGASDVELGVVLLVVGLQAPVGVLVDRQYEQDFVSTHGQEYAVIL